MHEKLFAFCVRFAKQYPTLPLGEHSVRYKNNAYMVRQIIMKKSTVETSYDFRPNSSIVRYNYQNHCPEIWWNLKYHYSVILFLVVWAFLRPDCSSDIEADQKAWAVLIHHKIKIKTQDFYTMLIETLLPVETYDNKQRIKKLINKFK